jgi:hypothetical protein
MRSLFGDGPTGNISVFGQVADKSRPKGRGVHLFDFLVRFPSFSSVLGSSDFLCSRSNMGQDRNLLVPSQDQSPVVEPTRRSESAWLAARPFSSSASGHAAAGVPSQKVCLSTDYRGGATSECSYSHSVLVTGKPSLCRYVHTRKSQASGRNKDDSRGTDNVNLRSELLEAQAAIHFPKGE